MNEVRIIATPDGPAVLTPTGGDALRIATAIARAVECSTLPADSAVVTTLRDHGRALMRAEAIRDRGEGFTAETACHTPRQQWESPRQRGLRMGLTSQAVTKRCRLGQEPGAQQIDNLHWIIPVDPEEHEDHHGDIAA